MPHSLSLSLEAVRGVRRSAIFGAAAFYFGNRAVQTKRNDFGLCREMGPRAARRGRAGGRAAGRGRGREGSQSVGRLSASLERIDLSRSPNLAK